MRVFAVIDYICENKFSKWFKFYEIATEFDPKRDPRYLLEVLELKNGIFFLRRQNRHSDSFKLCIISIFVRL